MKLHVLSVLIAWMTLHFPAKVQARTSIDDMINWSDPTAMPQQKFVGILDANTKDPGKPLYVITQNARSTSVSFQVLKDDRNNMLDGRLFGGAFKVQKIEVWYSLPSLPGGEAYHLNLELSNENLTKKKIGDLKAFLAQKTGDAHPKEVQSGRSGPTGLQWAHPKYKVILFEYRTSLTVSIDSLTPLPSAQP